MSKKDLQSSQSQEIQNSQIKNIEKEEVKEDKVLVSKEDYESMLSRIQRLEDVRQPKKAIRVGEHKATVRVYEEEYEKDGEFKLKKWVVMSDIKNVREKIVINELNDREKTLICDLNVCSAKGDEFRVIKDVRYLDFLRTAPKVEVVLSEEKKEKFVTEGEKVPIMKYAERTVGTTINSPTMEKVGETVSTEIWEDHTYLVTFPRGNQLRLNSSALNI